MNYEAVYRTAPATTGLLNMYYIITTMQRGGLEKRWIWQRMEKAQGAVNQLASTNTTNNLNK